MVQQPPMVLTQDLADRAELESREQKSLEQHAAKILPYLRQQDVHDIVTNNDGRLWVNRAVTGWECAGAIPTGHVRSLLRATATMQEISFGPRNPILETVLPLDGSRIEGIIPPIVSGAVMAIRLRSRRVYTFFDYDEAGILTHQDDPLNIKRHRDDFLSRVRNCKTHLEVLELGVQYRRNFLIVGGTGTGKTTKANAVLEAINRHCPKDRIVIIEDTPELQCVVPNSVSLLSTSKIKQVDCLVASLRLIPTRIVVGEVRRKKPARVLLESWSTGHSGSVATMHGNDSKEGLDRLEQLIDRKTARAESARAVHIVVFIDVEPSIQAGRKVREILVLDGLRPDGTYNCYRV
jgi:type IV secretion system protein TrbB